MVTFEPRCAINYAPASDSNHYLQLQCKGTVPERVHRPGWVFTHQLSGHWWLHYQIHAINMQTIIGVTSTGITIMVLRLTWRY